MQVRRLRIGQRIFEPMDIQRVARIVDSSSEFRRRGSSMKNIPTGKLLYISFNYSNFNFNPFNPLLFHFLLLLKSNDLKIK